MESQTREGALLKQMSNAVNSGISVEAFVDAAGRDHRWCQRQLYRQMVKPLIKEYARKAEAGDYDDRNEPIVKECSAIVDAMDW